MAADGRNPATVVHYDVCGLPAVVGTIDVLARLQLDARRGRCDVRLRNASPELLELIALCGLGETLPADGLAAEGPPARPIRLEAPDDS